MYAAISLHCGTSKANEPDASCSLHNASPRQLSAISSSSYRPFLYYGIQICSSIITKFLSHIIIYALSSGRVLGLGSYSSGCYRGGPGSITGHAG